MGQRVNPNERYIKKPFETYYLVIKAKLQRRYSACLDDMLLEAVGHYAKLPGAGVE